ncbi:MAG: tRNA (adenosine(37)-N6)-dimethylallyltransferase MiaA [Sphingobacteriales bacterium]|nr:MAG: tRNA (adenosine(37)-N6)-dimethylallyltransferase MiaA [Sphingobacteriales bacterium]
MPTVIVLAGPTAIGKTALSIQLAQHFNTSIVSADSRQCYREMNIGTAKPDAAELSAVPHYFINSHSIHDNINAAAYEQLALDYLENIFQTSGVAIVCGGTGLYIKALCEGIDAMPDVDRAVEAEIKQQFEEKGLSWLQEAVQAKDPVFFEQAEQQNHVRLIRALSFFETHQRSITEFKTQTAKERPFRIIKVALDLPREQLYTRINHRVDAMMEAGLLSEIEALYPFRQLKNLQTVGYSEFYEAGDFPLTEAQIEAAVDKVKQHTRNYAKRQLTWFRKDKAFAWFAPDDLKGVLDYIYTKN